MQKHKLPQYVWTKINWFYHGCYIIGDGRGFIGAFKPHGEHWLIKVNLGDNMNPYWQYSGVYPSVRKAKKAIIKRLHY